MTTRRRFLEVSAGAAALTLAGPLRPLAGAGPSRPGFPGQAEGLDILVLGGTGFIGPHVVSYAMARGHRITLFNRGRTNTHLFPEAEKLVGDRNDDLTALEGRTWDAVIDNSGYTPDQVQLSVELLKGSVGQYLFTSTRAVYRDFTADVMDEDAPLGPANVPEEQWEGYGPLKVLAERAVEAGFGSRTLIVRPPIIVGPGDRTDRFTYWVDRIDDGGEIMAWGDPDDPVQFIDVRDLAEFFVHLLEQDTPGIFNAEGPEAALSSWELLYGIRGVTTTPASFTWVDWDFLTGRGEEPQGSLPFWQPPSGRYLNYGRMVNTRAAEAGLRFRPLAVTAKETLDWHRTRPLGQQGRLRVGMSRAREAQLLQEWRDRG
ncbi:MAG: SDR family oxidoreductase [Gemmatimonadetes bacterium]|nr:SDR family oxidoreductase [Gemmatimonadota bacterium]